jgi:hypothetical protein
MPFCWFKIVNERFRLRLSAVVNCSFPHGLVFWDSCRGHGQTRLEEVSYSAASWLGGAKTRQNDSVRIVAIRSSLAINETQIKGQAFRAGIERSHLTTHLAELR